VQDISEYGEQGGSTNPLRPDTRARRGRSCVFLQASKWRKQGPMATIR